MKQQQTAMPAQLKPPKYKDEKKVGTAKRFLGDTLAGRFVRSAVQTTTSTFKLPTSLSPWGDNNRFGFILFYLFLTATNGWFMLV